LLARFGRGVVTFCNTSPPAAPLLHKERFIDTPVPLLAKERLGEVPTPVPLLHKERLGEVPASVPLLHKDEVR